VLRGQTSYVWTFYNGRSKKRKKEYEKTEVFLQVNASNN